MTFGDRLKNLRNNRGLTQSQLCDRLTINQSSLAMYELDKREPGFDMLILFSNYFNVSIDYLLTGSNPIFDDITPYSQMIKQAVEKSGLSMAEISDKLKSAGHKIDRSYISKLSNNPKYPASDEVNTALADILGIDSLQLRTLAWLEKIPPDVLEKLKESEKE